MAQPSIIICGSQAVRFSGSYLAYLRSVLLANSRLQKFSDAIKELPNLWNTLVEADPTLNAVAGKKALDQLAQWLEGEKSAPGDVEWTMNIQITPLTIIIHIVQYMNYLDTANPRISHLNILNDLQQGGFQGFCTGFLSATVLACSRDERDIGELGASALRLAVCIGAYVDLDNGFPNSSREFVCLAEHWKTAADKQHMLEVLQKYSEAYISVYSDSTSATITLPKSDVSSLAYDLGLLGVQTKEIPLSGRFHSLVHQDAYNKLERLCAATESLRFPDAARPLVPLRRNVNGDSIDSNEPLHVYAMRCMLLEVSNWSDTISKAVNALKEAAPGLEHRIIVLGVGDCIPRHIKKNPSIQVINLHNQKHTETRSVSDDTAYRYPEDAIAIVGMACRYPGADSLEEYWKLIESGFSMLGELPEGRFPKTNLRRDPEGKIPLSGNFLRSADMWDHRFFKRSSREAASMDPQHRLALEVAYEALESAGYFNHKSPARDIGCYMGVAASDYEDNVASHAPTAFSVLGMVRAFTSGKISHFFGFSGPSLVFDTACSSSMVALHTACRALQARECSMALAGGVNVITSPNLHQNLGAANFLSHTGGSKSFDNRADGYCRGEGAGIVLLKRLDFAVADKDRILGVIVGSAVNQNDNTYPITVPVSMSQTSLYRRVLELAKMKPTTISYVEAHGTGTPKGDPIECASIRHVFGSQPDRKLYFGSVKGNIGHTEAASGVAGLIKVLLMMQKKQIPPQGSFLSMNTNIPPLEPDNMEIATQKKPWVREFLAACVNNYGAAGSNAALVVTQPPVQSSQSKQVAPISASAYPILLSANTPSSLKHYVVAVKDFLDDHSKTIPEGELLASTAFHLAKRHNRSFKNIETFTVRTVRELNERLQRLVATQNANISIIPKQKPVVLAFGGQTGDIIHFSKEMYYGSRLLQKYLDECDCLLLQMGVSSLFPRIFEGEPILDTLELHCMLFSLQYSSAAAWIAAGLEVATVIGHSFGQLTALCIAGVISISDAMKLIAGRASIMKEKWGADKGSMLLVQAEKQVVQTLISQLKEPSGKSAQIACYNGPNSFVVAGSAANIAAFEDLATSDAGIKTKRMTVTHAFHSHFVDNIMSEYSELAESITFRTPVIPIETCSEGKGWKDFTPGLVAQQSRLPVFFTEAVERIAERLGPCTWIEAGSNSGITNMARRALKAPDQHDFHGVHLSGVEPEASLAELVVNLWKAGVEVDFWLFQKEQGLDYKELLLPPYTFERSRHWLDYIDHHEAPHSADAVGTKTTDRKPTLVTLVKYLDSTRQIAEFSVNQQHEQYQALVHGHAVLASTLCPASLYVEMAVSAASLLIPNYSPSTHTVRIEDLHMHAPLAIDLNRGIRVILTVVAGDTATWKFSLQGYSLSGDSSKSFLHADGLVAMSNLADEKIKSRFSRYERIVDYDRCEALLHDSTTASIQGPLVYRMFDKVVIYSEIFRGVSKISSKGHQVTGLVSLPSSGSHLVKDAVCNPLVVDNFTQVAGLHVNSLDDCGQNEVFLCNGIEQIDACQALDPAGSWLVYSSFERVGAREVANDVFVFDARSKELLMTMFGVRFSRVPIASLRKALNRANAALEQTRAAEDREPSNPAPRPVIHSQATQLMVVANKPAKSINSGNIQVRTATQALLNEVVDVPLEDITDNSRMENLGIDSLMATEVLSAIRERFGIEVPLATFQKLVDFKGLYGYIAFNTEGGILTPGPSLTTDDGDLDAQYTHTSTPFSDISSSFDKEQPADKSYAEQVASLAGLFVEHLDCESQIPPDTYVWDIGLDSLVGMELAADIQRIYDRRIDLASLDPECTFGQFCEMVIPKHQEVPVPVLEKIDKTVRLAANKIAYTAEPGSRVPKAASVGTVNYLTHTAKDFADMRDNHLFFARQTSFADFNANVYPQQRNLVCAYIVEAFAELGCDLRDVPAGSTIPPVSYIPKHEKVMNQYYKILEDSALVTITDQGILRTAKPVATVESQDLYRRIMSEFPQHQCEHLLLNSTASKLASCLSGEIDPLHILFGSKASKDLMEDVYTNSPMFATGTRILGDFFTKTFGKYRGQEKLRILELGAGTGGTTKFIVEKLLEHNIPFTYTFTDLSPSLVALAKRKFSHYGCLEFITLDVEKHPPEHLMNSYHAILSSNCVHATKNLLNATTNTRKLLRDDGFLCLLELTRNLFWLDCVFGLLEGWWLFEDGRKHVLADEYRWRDTLLKAGFSHIDWSNDETEESDQFRVIAAFVADIGADISRQPEQHMATMLANIETVQFTEVGGVPLLADIYYPSIKDAPGVQRPIALMVHGGGHVMLSRKDIRPKQTKLLLSRGLLPVSIDYRLCPEVSLTEGPISDVCTALQWVSTKLPQMHLQRPDVQPNGDKVVVVGWSTGGTLSMTLPFSAIQRGIGPPRAILAFYCPSDYEAEFYRQPNYPEETINLAEDTYDLLEDIQDHPITAYNVPAHKRAVGGWMSMSDPRSRIALHMNWKGQAMPVLLNGLPSKKKILAAGGDPESDPSRWLSLAQPSSDRVRAVSPYAQILLGNYKVPTFLIHGTKDDLIPWEQSQRTYDALMSQGVPAGLAIVEDAVHLFDLYRDADGKHWDAVMQGYDFILAQL